MSLLHFFTSITFNLEPSVLPIRFGLCDMMNFISFALADCS